MILNTHRRTIVLLRHIFDHSRRTEPIIKTVPQKPRCCLDEPIEQPFPRATPESQGIASDRIADFILDLHRDPELDQHGTMVLRHGKIIAEGGFGAYDQRIWHITHSECKSITGLAIGMLIDEGRLNLEDRIIDVMEEHVPRLAFFTHKNMTVRHLLTMSSGVTFNEFGAITETNWIKSFFDSSLIFEPGRRFLYNSMNTFMLSAIVRQISGQGLMAFLQDRLWEPLGIRNVFWETCPLGIEKGGWGLYIRPEDLAKVGQLVMQKGRWQDRQLVSEKWIAEATVAQITTPANMGGFDYGYQIWVGHGQTSFLFNGMFGQIVIGFPESGLMILSNAGDNGLIQQGRFFHHLDKHFPASLMSEDPEILPERPESYQRLQMALARLHDDKPIHVFDRLAESALTAAPPCSPTDAGQAAQTTQTAQTAQTEQSVLCRHSLQPQARDLLCSLLDGKTFAADPGESAAVGLLPVLTQVIQNNYSKGLSSFAFSLCDGLFNVIINEVDQSFALPVDFNAARTLDLDYHGEPYRVAVSGRFTTDEEDIPVLRLRISFLEIANSRIVKIFFRGDRIETHWSELPGKSCLTSGLAFIQEELKTFPMLDNILAKADNDFVRYKLGRTMEPVVTARLSD